ncbi:MAG: hypothetical protein QOD60_354 [Solirubrobacterales bacterium]|jgi:hypothetical protein|nr:hypothetical protein [Solirubrobacterales bacterium]
MTFPLLLAHALVARQDLPIPDWLFAWGASLVLIISFTALSFLWREPRFEDDDWRPLSERIGGLVVNPVTKGLAAFAGLFLFVLVIYSGLHGTDAPDRNFSLTFAFVTFWLGMVALSVLFGDVFRAFNPWRTIARGISEGFRLIAGQRAPAPLTYPDWLGRWPSVLGILAFAWLELIYGASGLTVGLNPHVTGVAVIVYSGITFAGMGLFGIDRWLERGEIFSVYMNMFSQLAPLEVRNGKLGRRKSLSAAGHHWTDVPGSVGLVIATIGATSFDGGQEGLFNSWINSWFRHIKDIGFDPTTAFRITESLILVIVVAGIGAVFWLGVWGMQSVDPDRSIGELRRKFGHTLIPIAAAYLLAHYFSEFVFQEQAQFTYLLSDPLGVGSNLFGTANSGIDYTVIDAKTVWYVQVGALVVGHVIGLTMAHDRAIALYKDPKEATRSQYWMLLVMICFTTFGLFLLSQGNG